jgi:molybdopterin converting factor small subunit
MTQYSIGKPARRKSVYGHNSGTTVEDVYVCPPNCTAEVTYILVANGSGSTNSVTIQWYVAEDTYTSHFLNDKSLAGGGYHEFSTIDLVLQPGDKIQVVPTAAGHIDSIVTVTETFVPIG